MIETTQPVDAPGKCPARRIRCKLETLIDCRREAAKLYREARGGQVDVLDARRLGALLLVVGSLIRDGEFEERLCALEKANDGE